MFGRRRAFYLATLLTLVGLACFVRPGHAQKPVAGKAALKPLPPAAIQGPIVGRAVGFA